MSIKVKLKTDFKIGGRVRQKRIPYRVGTIAELTPHHWVTIGVFTIPVMWDEQIDSSYVRRDSIEFFEDPNMIMKTLL